MNRRTKKYLILLIGLFVANSLYCQNTSIKGGILPAVYFKTVALGFEWKISDHSAIDLLGQAEMSMFHLSYWSYGILDYRIGYKYYVINPNDQFLNNHWIGGYFTQLKEQVSTCSEGSGFTANNFGIGISVGKKCFLSKRKNFFMNLGFRISYLKRKIISRTYCEEPLNHENTEDNSYFYFRPALILNFGFKL